jgi:hypothetical protein
MKAEIQSDEQSNNRIYNVVVGDRTTLNTRFALMSAALAGRGFSDTDKLVYRDFRVAPVDIDKGQRRLGCTPRTAWLRAYPKSFHSM